jgi:topoisomerase-4 subunit A
LLASDAGYGFVGKLGDFIANKRAGKGVLKVPDGARVLPPVPVADYDAALLVAITSKGNMLAFPLRDLPQMERGKGDRILAIPGAKVTSREEYLAAIAVVPNGAAVKIHTTNRHLSLKFEQLKEYAGERASRGAKLPKGYHDVQRIEVIL